MHYSFPTGINFSKPLYIVRHARTVRRNFRGGLPRAWLERIYISGSYSLRSFVYISTFLLFSTSFSSFFCLLCILLDLCILSAPSSGEIVDENRRFFLWRTWLRLLKLFFSMASLNRNLSGSSLNRPCTFRTHCFNRTQKSVL